MYRYTKGLWTRFWRACVIYLNNNSYTYLNNNTYTIHVQVHQGTVDTFLESILSQTVEETSRKQAMMEANAKVNSWPLVLVLF